MAKNKKQLTKKRMEWDAKRILSTIFVATISALLVIFFIAGDIGASCGGEGRGGQAWLARFKGGAISIGDPEISEQIRRMQEQDPDLEDLERMAIESLAHQKIFSQAANRFGLPFSKTTRQILLKGYLAANQVSPDYYMTADRAYRKEIESQFFSGLLERLLQNDISQASRLTALELRVENEARAIKSAIDLIEIRLYDLVSSQIPGDDELRSWFEDQRRQNGEESWRTFEDFDALGYFEQLDLVDSWQKAKAPSILASLLPEKSSALDSVIEAVRSGEDFFQAAQTAGLAVLSSDYFGLGDYPQTAKGQAMVDLDFYRELIKTKTGEISPVLTIKKDGHPYSLLVFRLRDRLKQPDFDLDLISDQAAFQAQPEYEQARIRELITRQRQELENELKTSQFYSFFSYLVNQADLRLNNELLPKI